MNKLDKLLSETSKPSSLSYAEDLNDPTYTVQYELFEKVCFYCGNAVYSEVLYSGGMGGSKGPWTFLVEKSGHSYRIYK